MKTHPRSSRAHSSSRDSERLSTISSCRPAVAATHSSSRRHATTSEGAHSYRRAEAITPRTVPEARGKSTGRIDRGQAVPSDGKKPLLPAGFYGTFRRGRRPSGGLDAGLFQGGDC